MRGVRVHGQTSTGSATLVQRRQSPWCLAETVRNETALTTAVLGAGLASPCSCTALWGPGSSKPPVRVGRACRPSRRGGAQLVFDCRPSRGRNWRGEISLSGRHSVLFYQSLCSACRGLLLPGDRQLGRRAALPTGRAGGLCHTLSPHPISAWYCPARMLPPSAHRCAWRGPALLPRPAPC